MKMLQKLLFILTIISLTASSAFAQDQAVEEQASQKEETPLWPVADDPDDVISVFHATSEIFHEPGEDEQASLWPVPDYTGGFLSRPTVTGDWGGLRTALANKGIIASVDILQTFQVLVDGGQDTGEEYGGSIDYELFLDFNKLGLWPGAFVYLFAETQFGTFVNTDVGTIAAANMDGTMPLPDEHETTLTSVTFTQFLAQWVAITIGKVCAIDCDANAFAHGRGKDQFLNSNFVVNPAGIVAGPYSALGAGLLFILPGQRGTVAISVLDANGVPNKAGFDDMFEDGVAVGGEARIGVKPFELPGHHLLGGALGTKGYMALDLDPRFLLNEWLTTGSVTIPEEDTTWAFYYNFDQYLFVEDDDPEQGIGIFGRFGLADDKTAPFEFFYSAGLGGKGIIPTRNEDAFGVGFYYIVASEKIPDPNDVFGDGQGIELFYNIEVTPWLHVTTDFQIIFPGDKRVDNAYVLGLRVKVDV